MTTDPKKSGDGLVYIKKSISTGGLPSPASDPSSMPDNSATTGGLPTPQPATQGSGDGKKQGS